MNLFTTFMKVALPVLLLTLIIPSAALSAEPDPEKAAEVNGTVITRKDLDNELDSFRQRMQQQGRMVPEAEVETLRKQLLNQMIDRELLYQDSRKKGISVEDSAVQSELTKLKSRFPNQEAFDKALAASDTSEAALKEKISEGLAIRELIDTYIAPKVSVSEKDTKKFYDEHPDIFQQDEQVKASHILIKVDAAADEGQKAEARKEIEQLQKQVKSGADFGQLARENSQGPSKDNDGDLGYFGRGQMVKPFETAAFDLEVGEVSDIVETQFGYHLIMVTDKKPASMVPYDEVEGKINEHLKQNRLEKELDQYLQALRQNAKIEKYL
jgi:peptidyl-prolyl cis-trans isomerase C